jgi:uncharacterized membrane protein YccF (DUF307 family)
MRTGLNFLWLVLGGWINFLFWSIAGLIFAISILGLPWARAAFVMARFSAWPFGKEAVSRADLTGAKDVGTGALGVIGNVIWFVVAGWWLALLHLFSAVVQAITIIGIPFAAQNLKLAGISLAPIGKTVVDIEVANELRHRKALRSIDEASARQITKIDRPASTS